jgi:hypothetical protein
VRADELNDWASYQVILEVTPEDKPDESAFATLYVRCSTGALVPVLRCALLSIAAIP